MKINEIIITPQKYIATVRIVNQNGSITARTTVTADNLSQARAILTRLYGNDNILSVTQSMNEQDTQTKVLSADQQRAKALTDQAKRLQQQAKQIKAQNAVKTAQSQLTKVNAQQQTH
jgi:hypothetical protein